MLDNDSREIWGALLTLGLKPMHQTKTPETAPIPIDVAPPSKSQKKNANLFHEDYPYNLPL